MIWQTAIYFMTEISWQKSKLIDQIENILPEIERLKISEAVNGQQLLLVTLYQLLDPRRNNLQLETSSNSWKMWQIQLNMCVQLN